MSKIPKIADLELWIERHNQFPFLITTSDFAEGPRMKKIISAGFETQVCLQDHGKAYYLRSEKDLKSIADKHLRFLKKTSKNDLKNIFSTARKYALSIKPLIKRVEKNGDAYLLENLNKIMEDVGNICVYTTSIPYFLLSALEKTDEKEFPLYKYVRRECEYLRNYSQFQVIQEKVLDKISASVSRKIGISEELVKYFSLDEILSIATGKQVEVSEKELKQRKLCLFWLDNKTKKTFFSYDKKIIEKIKQKILIAEKAPEIKGSIACKGRIKGIVKIVNSTLDMKKVEKGDIIVSRSTNPTLMPVLKTALGIITDEGGISCHAAIISRELKIPCIIGTKIATRILKDGMRVEMDADKGIIKIIK